MHTSSFSCSSLRFPVKVCIEAVPLTTLTFSTHWTSCGGFPFRRGSTVTSTTAPALVEIGCAFVPTTGTASNAIVSNHLGLFIAEPRKPLSSPFQSCFEQASRPPRSVLVRNAASEPIVRKFGEHRIRLHCRILVIERQHQIPPDFIIE